MAEFEGDVLRPPGVGPERVVAAPEEILASYSPPPLIKGGTVAAGVGVLRAGEPMKLAADGKTWIKAVFTAGTPGSFDSVIAVNQTAVNATTEAKLINLIFKGTINAKVAAITGREEALATALDGKYIENFGYITY